MTGPQDGIYYPDKGEKPKIEGCLIHPWSRAVKSYQLQGQGKFAGVMMGLCPLCQVLYESEDLDFIEDLKKEITDRLTKLEGE